MTTKTTAKEILLAASDVIHRLRPDLGDITWPSVAIALEKASELAEANEEYVI